MELPKRKITVCDIALTAILSAVLALSAVIPLTSRDASHFTVRTADSTETYSLALSETIPVVSNGIRADIICENGKVRIASSECPDLTCVNTGAISKPGETIVCVPAEIVITIPSAKDGQDETYIVG